MKSFLSDLLSVGLSKVGVIVFGLGYAIVTARYLGPELNGTIATLLVYPSLFMTIGSLGIRQSTAYYVGKGVYNDQVIKRAVVQLWYLSSIISVVVSYYLVKYFSNSGQDIRLTLLAVAPIPFTLFITYNSGLFLGKNQIQVFNKINWLPPLFKLMTVVVLVVILNYSIEGALFASVLAPFLMSIILIGRNSFIEGFSLKFEGKAIKSLLSLGSVYAIALLIINLNYKIDVILLDKLSSAYETGIYSKGASLIEYLWQIPMLLSTIVFARSASSQDNYAFSMKVTQLLRISIVIVGLACIALAILSDFIIQLLYGDAFASSASVLVYLLPGVLLLTIFKVLNMDMAGRGKPWISLKAMIPALFLNIVLNYFLIPTMGANGAAIASTISYSLAAFLFIIVYSREAGIDALIILKYSKSDFEPLTNGVKKVLAKF